ALRHSFVIGKPGLACFARCVTGHSSFVIFTIAILVDKNTRLVVRGITGSAGGFHARQCMEYGTNVVAGVTPGNGGQMFDVKVPVLDTVWETHLDIDSHVSLILLHGTDAAAGI